jgi:hypothetical protein
MDKPTITRLFLDADDHPHTFQYTDADFYIDDSSITIYYDAEHKPVAIEDADTNTFTLLDSNGKPGAIIHGKSHDHLHNIYISPDTDGKSYTYTDSDGSTDGHTYYKFETDGHWHAYGNSNVGRFSDTNAD